MSVLGKFGKIWFWYFLLNITIIKEKKTTNFSMKNNIISMKNDQFSMKNDHCFNEKQPISLKKTAMFQWKTTLFQWNTSCILKIYRNLVYIYCSFSFSLYLVLCFIIFKAFEIIWIWYLKGLQYLGNFGFANRGSL